MFVVVLYWLKSVLCFNGHIQYLQIPDFNVPRYYFFAVSGAITTSFSLNLGKSITLIHICICILHISSINQNKRFDIRHKNSRCIAHCSDYWTCSTFIKNGLKCGCQPGRHYVALYFHVNKRINCWVCRADMIFLNTLKPRVIV